jgi:AraC-like DNA-binding protein
MALCRLARHDQPTLRAPRQPIGLDCAHALRLPGSLSMDTLSDVLRVVRLTGAVYFTIDGSAPWVAETPTGGVIAPHIGAGVEHVVDYHIVTTGACWGGVLGEPPVRLEAGDIIVFPQGDAHVMSSAPGMRGQPDPGFYRTASQARFPISLSLLGGGTDCAQLICGFLGCDARPFNPLLAALPRLIHVRQRESDSTLRRLIELALAESSAPSAGSDGVLARASELLFVEVVRRHVAGLPPDEVGWFAGLRDESVGRALQKLHDRPAHPWTIEELGKEIGVSRSVLAERFTHFVGLPPIQYLAKWRVQLAASLLRTTQATLAEIAERVGYGSEPALSRAFKRWVGVAPARYRRGAGPQTPI